jgi:voltage-gated potassium channel
MKYTEKIIESSVLLLVIIDMILLLILTFSNVSQHVEPVLSS